MATKQFIKYLAPFTIVVILVIFILNLITHGSIQHPGKSSYLSKCAGCHGDNGEGIKVLVPPLMNADFALQNFDSIPCWLKNGLNHPITINGVAYDQPMYGLELDEIQIANLMNYMSSEFMNSDKQVTSLIVKQQLKNCK